LSTSVANDGPATWQRWRPLVEIFDFLTVFTPVDAPQAADGHDTALRPRLAATDGVEKLAKALPATLVAFILPHNDADVIAGAFTVALEIRGRRRHGRALASHGGAA
jgi:hypothetical protein